MATAGAWAATGLAGGVLDWRLRRAAAGGGLARYVLLSQHDLDRVTHYFERWGGITVFFGRLLPVVRTFIALPAGLRRCRRGVSISTRFSARGRGACAGVCGDAAGDHWDNDPRFKEIFHRFHLVVVLLLVVGFAWFVWSHWRSRMRTSEPA